MPTNNKAVYIFAGWSTLKTWPIFRIWLAFMGLLLLLSSSAPVYAVDRTVCASGCAFTTIQAAINASANGDTVKVAQGTYNENLTISSKSLTLIGGFVSPNFTTPSTNPSLTIIDASGKNDSAIFIGSALTGKVVRIENFTIKNGTGRFDGSVNNGGGIRVQKATATIRNNIIENNIADAGGGIQITDDNNPLAHLIENNIIRNNTARQNKGVGFGGGIDINTSVATLRGNTITGNKARCGGAIVNYASATTIENNIISNNQALFSNSGQGCTGGDGGALFIELVDKSPVIKNNLITGNVAIRGDGINIAVGPGQPQIINNTISDNQNANGFDEGIFYVGVNITPIIRNNIITFNGSGIHRGNNVNTPNPVISNNIVFGNSQTNYRNLSAGSGDISADPLFVNRAGGDYHLQTGSPAIDSGTNTNAPGTDLEGGARPLDGDGNGNAQWDMGAYEFAAWLIKTVNPVAVEPNDIVEYTIKFQNNSPITATGVVITDLLSSDFTNISFSASGATVVEVAGPQYTWDVQDLSSGQTGIITVTAQVKGTVSTPLAITNSAQFATTNVGTYSSQATLLVGALKSYLPILLKNQ